MGRLKSFTLIETIIVVGITGLILPIIFSIVFVILQQQTKIIRLQEVKRQGDFILSNIRTTIRNSATQIYSDSLYSTEQCGSKDSTYAPGDGGATFYFKDRIGNWFKYYLSAEKISSESANGITELTNNKVKVTSYDISCQKESLYSTAIVSLSIELQYNSTSSRKEDNAQLIYRNNIKLKSF